MITVEQLDIEQFDLVLDLVTRLLQELREETDDPVAFDAERIRQGWLANQDRFTAFVALDEDKTTLGLITLVGSFAFYADGACGVISELYVLPEHRSKKIGKILIETAKGRAAVAGYETAAVEPRALVAPMLLEQQPGQRLNAGEENDATFLLVALIEGEVRSHDLGHGWRLLDVSLPSYLLVISLPPEA